MKGSAKAVFFRAFLCSTCLWLAWTICSNAQANPASAVSHPKEEPPKDFSLKVAVEEVRIDAVVLDRKGHQITDLTADDFELYQDGKLQKITSCAYVNEYQAMSRDSSKAGLRVSAPMLPRDRVRRTIAFIVDDLSMDAYEHFLYTRMALQKFVESQMQPGDLVVIFQSSGGALLQFSSDKRQLLSTIKNLRWKGGRGGMIGCGPDGCGTAAIAVGASPDFNSAVDAQYTSDALKRQAWINRGRFLPGPQGASEEAYADYRRRLLESQIAILRYCLRTVRDMPGRKSILFMSSVITFPEVSFGKLGQSTPYAAFKSLDQDSIYLNIRQLFDKVADEALRAGAVIFTLDMKGLEVDKNVGSNETYIPVSKKTGGIIIEDSNFFLGGIGPAEEELKGYYLLSFIPPTNTFDENRRGSYRHIQVKVKRHGNKVRSRDGYFGTAHPPDLASTAEKNTLQQAIFSPFLYSDLRLSLASGYAYTPAPGYFLRSWLHLDGKDLIFTDGQEGRHVVVLELVTLTSDSNGMIQDSKALEYRLKVNDQDLSRIRQEGLDFDVYLPVKNPGDYYVRAAVRDRASGKIGSAYQFLEIPDLSKNRLSLSSIFLFNREVDVSAIKSGHLEKDSDSSDAAPGWQGAAKSPALRTYLPGEGFDHMAVVYNAATGGAQPTLESQFTLFKDGKEYYRGNPENVAVRKIGDLRGIPIIRRMFLGSQIDEGSYVLRLTVTDGQAKKKFNTAAQVMDFEIRKGASNNP